MEKTLKTISVLFIALGLSTMLLAQEGGNSYLKISPVQFGKSYFEVSLELGLNEGRSSIQLSPMFLLKRNQFEEFSGIQGELQYRSYLKRLNKGENNTWIFSDVDFFAGAYALGLSFKRDYEAFYYDPMQQLEIRDEFTRDIFSAEGGVFVGVKFILADKLVLEFLAGGGVRYSEVDDTIEDSGWPDNYYYNSDESDVFDLGYYGVKPRLNLQLGIRL